MDQFTASATGQATLRTHQLAHLPELKVDRCIFESRFIRGCATANCTAACCRTGVQVDVSERDRILSQAELIQRAMDPAQDKNPAHWFERDEEVDTDMPSGRAVGTLVRGGACVFLNGAGRCVLQLASAASTDQTVRLKPFFCYAFPITIEESTLTIDLELATQGRCCSSVADGPLSLFDVCAVELRYVLGADGAEALRALASAGARPAAKSRAL